jgi:hypothetical protein
VVAGETEGALETTTTELGNLERTDAEQTESLTVAVTSGDTKKAAKLLGDLSATRTRASVMTTLAESLREALKSAQSRLVTAKRAAQAAAADEAEKTARRELEAAEAFIVGTIAQQLPALAMAVLKYCDGLRF